MYNSKLFRLSYVHPAVFFVDQYLNMDICRYGDMQIWGLDQDPLKGR